MSPEIAELLAKADAIAAAREEREEAAREEVRAIERELRANRARYDAEWRLHS